MLPPTQQKVTGFVGICLLTARGSVPQATSLPITFSAFLKVLCPFGDLQDVPGKRGGVSCFYSFGEPLTDGLTQCLCIDRTLLYS